MLVAKTKLQLIASALTSPVDAIKLWMIVSGNKWWMRKWIIARERESSSAWKPDRLSDWLVAWLPFVDPLSKLSQSHWAHLEQVSALSDCHGGKREKEGGGEEGGGVEMGGEISQPNSYLVNQSSRPASHMLPFDMSTPRSPSICKRDQMSWHRGYPCSPVRPDAMPEQLSNVQIRQRHGRSTLCVPAGRILYRGAES